MKILICIYIFIICSYGTTIKDLEITQDSNRVDINFILDKSFNNSIIKKEGEGFSAIVIKDIDYSMDKISKKTNLIRNIEVFKRDLDVYVVLVGNNINLDYDINANSYNNFLKISITPKDNISNSLIENSSLENAINNIKNQELNNEDITSLVPSRPNGVDNWRYSLVIIILISLIILLVVVKRKVYRRDKILPFSYFKKPSLSVTQTIPVDTKSKIVIMESKDYKYILFVGEQNSFIIDKVDNKTIDENIGELLKNNRVQKISHFLKVYENEAKKHT